MNKLKNESGVVFVEASVVFPVMFLVIILMLYMGNAYLQKCRIEALVNKAAAEGAAYCADPLLRQAGSLPSVGGLNVYPYRAFSGDGVGDVESELEGKLQDQIEELGAGYFMGMHPRVVSGPNAVYHNAFIYGTFEIAVEYEIVFPIRMIGADENVSIKMRSLASMPVSDTSEMIRNVDMIEDYLEQLGVIDKLQELKDKIGEVVSKLTGWMD